MKLQVEEFDKRNVELSPDNMDMLTDTELTQYYIQSWSLDYNNPGDLQMYPNLTDLQNFLRFLRRS